MAFLGAFGKHPGWDDHIDDQGLETQRLVDLKSLLYVEGISARLDSGVWDNLDPQHALPEFDHTFVLHARGDWALGRLWSSRDGKGRSRYPMVVAAQIVGAPLDWALREVLPELGRLREACIRATTAPEAIAAINAARSTLRRQVATVPPGQAEATIPAGSLVELADHPDLGPNRRGMHRILYQVEREFGDFLAVRANPVARHAEPRPQQIRVPPAGTWPEQVFARWLGFAMAKLGPRVPVLAVLPTGKPWIDLLVGEPTGTQLYCLRAGPKAIPLTSEIPYSLDPSWCSATDRWIDATRAGPPVEIRTPPMGHRANDQGRFA